MSEPIPSSVKRVLLLGMLLLNSLLAGCASHQVTDKPLTPTPVTSFEAMQLQVNFATPAQSDYLAAQLVNELARHGVNAMVVTTDATPTATSNRNPKQNLALLHLTLTDTWTETFISHRYKHRRSLTQMRGRIERESPRFRSEVVLRDMQSGSTVWQSETVTAGPWYSDFNANARSLARKLVHQLQQQDLIAPASDPLAQPAPG